MGTNYYLEPKPPCPYCGRHYDQIHIGKSSAGWCFSLHIIPEKGINNLDDWIKLWTIKGSVITDEYGDTISPKEMLDIITNRSWLIPSKRKWTAIDYEVNNAMPGPNGLVRSKLDTHCIGHGDGTWDLVVGEFS